MLGKSLLTRLNSLLNDPLGTLLLLAAIIVSLTVHELFHGLMAYRLGDPTAKNQGRLTLNPLAHIDPIGFIVLLLFGFGWAKPVPANPLYYKSRKKGMALTAAAGPFSNFLLAALCAFFLAASFYYTGNSLLFRFFSYMISINAGLGIFNLLPIPPLDGSHILALFLPNRMYYKMLLYSRQIQILLFIALFIGILDAPLDAMIGAASGFFFDLANTIFSLI